jgi:hypothetical protein
MYPGWIGWTLTSVVEDQRYSPGTKFGVFSCKIWRREDFWAAGAPYLPVRSAFRGGLRKQAVTAIVTHGVTLQKVPMCPSW